MFSKVFLAVTAQDQIKRPPQRLAYMALHFSSYGKGLSNIPSRLPEGSILLLDDSMPPKGHDLQIITNQLQQLSERFSPSALLLDFQRPVTEELEIMASGIIQALPCPVAVTEAYAKKFSCPVFLPPVPVNKSLTDYLNPWKKQGIFLETAPEGLEFTVTQNGSSGTHMPPAPELPLFDKQLHCHYDVKVFPEKVVFTMGRSREDLAGLIREAEALGVLGCVGLYRELQA